MAGENMIERVARAIRRDKFIRTRRQAVFDESLPLTDNELSEARAAIEELREPSGAMWRAGRNAISGPLEMARTADRYEMMSAHMDRIPDRLFNAMMDAALSTTQPDQEGG